MPVIINYIDRIAEVAIDYYEKVCKKTSNLKDHLKINRKHSDAQQIEALSGAEALLLKEVESVVSRGSSRLPHLQFFITRYVYFRKELVTAKDWTESKWKEFTAELKAFYQTCHSMSQQQVVKVMTKLPGKEAEEVSLSALTATDGLFSSGKSDFAIGIDGHMLRGDWQTGIEMAIRQYRQQFIVAELLARQNELSKELATVQTSLHSMVMQGEESQSLSLEVAKLTTALELLEQQLEKEVEARSAAEDALRQEAVGTSAEFVDAAKRDIEELRQGQQSLVEQVAKLSEPKPVEGEAVFNQEHLALLLSLKEEIAALKAENQALSQTVSAQQATIGELCEERPSIEKLQENMTSLRQAQQMRFFHAVGREPHEERLDEGLNLANQ